MKMDMSLEWTVLEYVLAIHILMIVEFVMMILQMIIQLAWEDALMMEPVIIIPMQYMMIVHVFIMTALENAEV